MTMTTLAGPLLTTGSPGRSKLFGATSQRATVTLGNLRISRGKLSGRHLRGFCRTARIVAMTDDADAVMLKDFGRARGALQRYPQRIKRDNSEAWRIYRPSCLIHRSGRQAALSEHLGDRRQGVAH